ncbi:MAG: hypothetical protein AUK55_15820 [Syntrophobacteraceae bacterium CG2_30_61_12]|nr:MAG: hypothetical protein AUK55_15820 [Syntrophobacteraceae bacterium CG2_30_61_12]
MPMNRVLSFFLAWVLAGTLQPSVSTAKTVDGIVAVINSDILLYSELEQEWQRLLQANPSLRNEPPAKQQQLQRDLLQHLVRNRLTTQEAKRLKLTVADAEVDRAIAGIKKENGLSDQQLEVVLGQEGRSLEELRQQVREEMLRGRIMERIFKSKTVITEDQIDHYLQTHSGGELRQRLAVIALPVTAGMSSAEIEALRKQAETIHERLDAGDDFAKLAGKYSQGPGADEGGDIGFIAAGDLAQPLREATQHLKPGQYTRVLQTKGGFYILKILEAKTESRSGADAQVRERASRELMRAEVNRKFEEWVKDLEKRAFIQINSDLLTNNVTNAKTAN